MRKLSFLVIAVVMLSFSAFAQDRVQVYGGYSLFRLDGNTNPTDRSFNGWDGELAGKISPLFSIVGDVNGQYHNISGTDIKENVYSFLAGPRVSFTSGKFTPFAHVMFGLAHSAANSPTLGNGSDNNFATAFGGGVDIKMSPFMSIRPAKLDYMLVKTNPNLVTDVNGNPVSHTNNFRYSAGVVFHF